MGNSDLILGIQWLAKLGTMTSNWKTQVLPFNLGTKKVTLQEDPSLGRTLISLKAMVRAIRKKGGGILVEMNKLEGVESSIPTPAIPSSLKPIINKHSHVFSLPKELLPLRVHEHYC